MRRVLVLVLFIFQVSCISAPKYKGPVSDHFDGTEFSNRIESEKGFWDFFKLAWGFFWDKETWPAYTNIEGKKVKLLKNNTEIAVTFVNHSTFLLQIGKYKVLTDPIFSNRASPWSWVGPKRVRGPGVVKEDLPNIDMIIVSHNHYDHLDIESLKWISEHKGNPLMVVGLGVGLLLKEKGLNNYIEMDWGESKAYQELEVSFTECRHRSGRGLGDQMSTLWGSFVIEHNNFKIYFAGDTGYGPYFKEAQKSYGDFHLSLLPIGAYDPRWFMSAVHLNPAEAVQAHLDLKSKQSIGMHFGTFQLTYEGLNRPKEELSIALETAGVGEKLFLVPDFGETYFFKRE